MNSAAAVREKAPIHLSAPSFLPAEVQILQDALEEIAARQAKGEILAPRKYFMAIRDTAVKQLIKIHHQQPDLPPQLVVGKILSRQDEKLRFPPDEVMKLTRFILDEWEKLSQPTS